MSYDLFLSMKEMFGVFSGPDDIPFATVPIPPVLGPGTPPSLAAKHMLVAWNQVTAWFDNIQLKDAKNRNMAILRNTGKADGLEVTVQEWLDIDASPSPLLWFFWCRSSDTAKSMRGAVGVAKQVWNRKEYWETFGTKYQTTRKLWTPSGVEWATRWKRVLNTALAYRDDMGHLVATMEDAFGPGMVDADALAAAAIDEVYALQHRIDAAAEALKPGLWMWDWTPRYKVRGACDSLGL